MFRSRVALVATLALVSSVVVATPAHAATVTVTIDNVTYTAENTDIDAGATITASTTPAAALVIPDTVDIGGDTYAVTAIIGEVGVGAFQGKGLTSVTIPDSVTTIGFAAFRENSLTTVDIPQAVTAIGEAAFFGNDLDSVTISNNVTSIGNLAFYDNGLSTITIGDNVETIGNNAFALNDLTSVTIPDSVITIGINAFATNSITTLTLGNNVEVIDNSAFSNNDLTAVTIPDSVTTNGEAAFYVNFLEELVIPNNVTSIGKDAFYDNSLTSLIIGDGVTTIGDTAFFGNNLTSLSLGDNVTSIGAGAFQNSSLTSVTFPASVTSIGESAFETNPLVSVLFEGDAPTLSSAVALGSSSTLVKYAAFAEGFTNPWNGGGVTDYVTALNFPSGIFDDVPSSRSFAREIEWLAHEGVTEGYSDGTYRPLGTVNRDAMAAFLYRFAGEPSFTPPAESEFTDITPGTPFYKEITWLADTGITGGYTDGTFRAGQPVNRDAMAAFLYRFAGEPSFTPPAVSEFTDITPGTPFYKEITWLADTGITGGYTDGTFRAGQPVNRDAMAAFLFRFDDQGLAASF